MYAKSLIVLATAALAAAAPQRRSCGSGKEPTLPKNPDSDDLPLPEEGLKLKRIALGYGIQNYTCESRDSDAKATGALAGLYDITHLFPGQSDDSLDQDTFDRLTDLIVESAPDNFPLHQDGTEADRVPAANPGADASSPFKPAAALPVPGLDIELPHTGDHFFNSDGVPVFELDGGLSIFCELLDREDAPDDASPGNDDVGAVAWLRLGAVDGSQGLKFVYRVQTGAGNSHGCEEGGSNDSSFYTAAYWFYG